MRIGWPGQARLSLVRQSPLVRGRFSFQDEVWVSSLTSIAQNRRLGVASAVMLARSLWPSGRRRQVDDLCIALLSG
jgi:hypothetical protein